MRFVDKHRMGLVFGYFVGMIHLLWSLLVAITPDGAQGLLEWTFRLHHIEMSMATMRFNAGNALMLIVVAFGSGYGSGWMLGWLWNRTGEQAMRRSAPKLAKRQSGPSGT